MLEMRKSTHSFQESDLIELERIAAGADEKEALVFVQKLICDRTLRARQGRLRPHLDAAGTVEGFIKNSQQVSGGRSL